jgi:hypothetical protein
MLSCEVRFNDFERRVAEGSNDLVSVNKVVSLKDKELADLQRQISELNERGNNEIRSVKNCYEEELHHLKLRQSEQVNKLQEETRNEKARVLKLEERLKAEGQAGVLREKELAELERKNEELKEKIVARAKEVREEKSTADKYLLENEELKRRIIREEARNKQLTVDNQMFEQEVHNVKKATTIETVVNHTETDTKKGGQPGASEESEAKLVRLKDKLKASNEKLVRAVSEKVILLHALNQLGVDIPQLLKTGGASILADPAAATQHAALTPASQQPLALARRLLGAQPPLPQPPREYTLVQDYVRTEPTQGLVSKYLAPGVPVEEVTGTRHQVPLNPQQPFDQRQHQYTLAYPELLDPYVLPCLIVGHPGVLQHVP